MSPELKYFEQFGFWTRLASWLSGKKKIPRRQPPVRLRRRVTVEYQYSQNPEWIRGSVREFSLEGIRFAAHVPPAAGQSIELRLVFPEEFKRSEAITLKTRVRRLALPPGRRRYRVGCEFIETAPEDRIRLSEFLAWNLSE